MQGGTWRTPHHETKSRMMGAKKMTEATSGTGRTPGNAARQLDSSGRYGAPGTQPIFAHTQGSDRRRTPGPAARQPDSSGRYGAPEGTAQV